MYTSPCKEAQILIKAVVFVNCRSYVLGFVEISLTFRLVIEHVRNQYWAMRILEIISLVVKYILLKF